MARHRLHVISALLLTGLVARAASAQIALAPESPRWDDTFTVTLGASSPANQALRVSPADRLYAVVFTRHQLLGTSRERIWVPMTWDGHRFAATMTLRTGCEAGYAFVATTERLIGTGRAFTCRTPDGLVPPGAITTGLLMGAWDAANWKADLAKDLAALREVPGHGWEQYPAWLVAWNKDKLPREERRFQVERVEREAGADAGPALLSAIAAGYFRAGEPRRGFDVLRRACDRFPASEHTVGLGLSEAAVAVVNSAEFEGELNALLARVAAAAPQNRSLRELFTRLATRTDASLATIRAVAQRWTAEYPRSSEPHYVLATALAAMPDHAAEADAEISRAIALSLEPHPFDAVERTMRQRAFRLRAKLRADRNDLVGAIADARMAQQVAEDKVGAEDLSAEAALWQRLEHTDRAERLASEAYQRGSLEAEAVLKQIYTAQTGSDAGFRDYLIARLRTSDPAEGSSLKPVPEFSATTLDGARVDNASLREKITVVDFWFINCPPCRAERPKLNAIVDEFGDRVRFVGFALDSPDALRTYQATTPLKYEIVPKSDPIARAFGVSSFPNHMIIDRSGRIVWLAGTDDDRIERLRAMIFRVLARSGDK